MIPSLPELNALVRLAYGGTIVPSRVEGLDSAGMLLAAPDDTAAPEPGTVLTMHWASPRGASEIRVTFAGEDESRIRLWRVAVAGSAELVQRREFARAKADEAQVALVPLRPAITSVRTGWILDISEGGARCAFPSGQAVEGEEVELHLDLGGPVVVAVGTVLRALPTFDGNDEVVVEYEVSERVADQIRAYVFSRQRRQRRPVRR